MKSKIKNLIAGTVILVLALCYTLNAAAAISIDGNMDSVEWDSADKYVIIDSDDRNCDVDFALMKVIVDNEARTVTFCFACLCNNLEQDNTNAGVSVCIDSSDAVISNAANSPLNLDANDYVFSAYTKLDTNNGLICELRVSFRNGIPEKIPVKIQIIDGDGRYSNVYRYTIANADYTTESTIFYNSTTERQTTTAQRKTTKETTVKKSTTKKNTTKRSTTKSSISISIIDIFPDFNFVTTSQKTTKPSTTDSTTVKKETTKKKTTTTEKATTVIYYIVNNITNVAQSEPATDVQEISTATDKSATPNENLMPASEIAEQSVKALLEEESRNKKYIKRTAVACGLILGAAALWGVSTKIAVRQQAKNSDKTEE